MIFSPFMNRLNILFLFVIAYAAKASSTDIVGCSGLGNDSRMTEFAVLPRCGVPVHPTYAPE